MLYNILSSHTRARGHLFDLRVNYLKFITTACEGVQVHSQTKESGSQDLEEVQIKVVRIECWVSDISNFILTLSYTFSPMTSNR